MPEHENVLHLEDLHGEFERGARALVFAIGFIGRHEVRHIAHDEDFAGARIEDDLRRNAGIAARDNHHIGLLPAFGEPLIMHPLAGHPACAEALMPL